MSDSSGGADQHTSAGLSMAAIPAVDDGQIGALTNALQTGKLKAHRHIPVLMLVCTSCEILLAESV